MTSPGTESSYPGPPQSLNNSTKYLKSCWYLRGTCGTVGAGDVDVDVAVIYGTTINNDDYLRHVFSANLYLVLEYQVSRTGYCVLKVMV